MLVLVSDYKEVMEADYSLTIDAIEKSYRGRETLDIIVAPYESEEYKKNISQADGLVTAFLPVDEKFIEQAPKLKYISINAAGFSNLELAALEAHKVKACHIKEYCTREVSEHALSMLMTLNNNIKGYDLQVSQGNWNYGNMPMRPTLNHLKVVIYGFGKIGKSTNNLLKSLGVEVYFVDPFVSEEAGAAEGAIKLEENEVFEIADVIINHMALTDSNYHMFNYDFFKSCVRKPIFINVGRGGCVEEAGLLKALEEGLVYGAGLDVLEEENPDLSKCDFLHRWNVVLTPHAAFYSENSMRALHEISGRNLGLLMSGEDGKTEEIIK